MKLLLVTEKLDPANSERDGGARLVATLKLALGSDLTIVQFGGETPSEATYHFRYPHNANNRFESRTQNAKFIGKTLNTIANDFTHIIFVHASLQFGLGHCKLNSRIKIITFPMFLSCSYALCGENVPETYFDMEYASLTKSHLIITPSHFEKRQLINKYGVPEEKIRVIPRGVHEHFSSATPKACQDKLKFCSIGSIKPQKNTLALIRFFSEIHRHYPGSHLEIIGPVQNLNYHKKVVALVKELKLTESIQFHGHVPYEQLPDIIKDSHLHITTSSCETFGRAIFETLALGLPNVAKLENNAARDFLKQMPYIHFVDNHEQGLRAIHAILPHLETLSTLAREIGTLFDESLLSKLLKAEILEENIIGISDFDGTLFHKNNELKTEQSIEAFKQFPTRVICSARSLDDLLTELKTLQLRVDWIIAYSGAVVTDGNGKVYWTNPLSSEQLHRINRQLPQCEAIQFGKETLQLSTTQTITQPFLDLRTETYQNKTYIAPRSASKLQAIIKLLNQLGPFGRVRVFGDGMYDREMLTYFDGTLVR